jgi:hypothetical protein
MGDLPNVRACLDDILVTTAGSYEDHLKYVELVLQCLTDVGFATNGIIERVHQVLGNALRTFELEKKELNTNDPWGPFLSAAAWAIRSTVHTTLDATPGQLGFG